MWRFCFTIRAEKKTFASVGQQNILHQASRTADESFSSPWKRKFILISSGVLFSLFFFYFSLLINWYVFILFTIVNLWTFDKKYIFCVHIYFAFIVFCNFFPTNMFFNIASVSWLEKGGSLSRGISNEASGG